MKTTLTLSVIAIILSTVAIINSDLGTKLRHPSFTDVQIAAQNVADAYDKLGLALIDEARQKARRNYHENTADYFTDEELAEYDDYAELVCIEHGGRNMVTYKSKNVIMVECHNGYTTEMNIIPNREFK
jgi:hypothetical protein